MEGAVLKNTAKQKARHFLKNARADEVNGSQREAGFL